MSLNRILLYLIGAVVVLVVALWLLIRVSIFLVQLLGLALLGLVVVGFVARKVKQRERRSQRLASREADHPALERDGDEHLPLNSDRRVHHR